MVVALEIQDSHWWPVHSIYLVLSSRKNSAEAVINNEKEPLIQNRDVNVATSEEENTV